jgi:hypothetical protein
MIAAIIAPPSQFREAHPSPSVMTVMMMGDHTITARFHTSGAHAESQRKDQSSHWN